MDDRWMNDDEWMNGWTMNDGQMDGWLLGPNYPLPNLLTV